MKYLPSLPPQRALRWVPIVLCVALPADPILAAPTATQRFVFENVELHTVVEEVAQVTGIAFLFDPDRVKGKITLVAPGAVTPARALELLRSALALHGYALVGRAEGMSIVPVREAEPVVVQVLPLTYASADEVAFTLSGVAPPGVRIAPYYPTNSVVISGPAAAVERLVTIIRGR